MPYRVINNIGTRYTVQNLVTNKKEDFDVRNMKPYEVLPHSNPRLVANKDTDVEDAEAILAHKGNQKKKNIYVISS